MLHILCDIIRTVNSRVPKICSFFLPAFKTYCKKNNSATSELHDHLNTAWRSLFDVISLQKYFFRQWCSSPRKRHKSWEPCHLRFKKYQGNPQIMLNWALKLQLRLNLDLKIHLIPEISQMDLLKIGVNSWKLRCRLNINILRRKI